MIPVKYGYRPGVRWAFMRWMDIPSAWDSSVVYLRRLKVLQTPWFAVYLHFIYEPDDDRDPHDHPCNFWSLIVRGGYVEAVYPNVGKMDFAYRSRVHRRGSIHRMRISAAHRIVLLRPGTVTLCLFGSKRKAWGFWTVNGFVSWQDYNGAKFGVNPQSMLDEFA